MGSSPSLQAQCPEYLRAQGKTSCLTVLLLSTSARMANFRLDRRDPQIVGSQLGLRNQKLCFPNQLRIPATIRIDNPAAFFSGNNGFFCHVYPTRRKP